LREALDEQALENGPRQRKFRLFVVEDLSSDVIELLGAHYDVEPAFFRDQIVDYAWYNTRDRWMDPPRLDVVARRQRWLQIRFPTSRYFENHLRFKEGCDQFESFTFTEGSKMISTTPAFGMRRKQLLGYREPEQHFG
jgi:hypothetical protein